MIRIKSSSFSAMDPRTLIVIAVIAAILNVGMPRGQAAVEKLSLKTESQIRSEANLYDTAIREISRIETMKFATAEDFKSVKTILDRQVPNLRFQRSKLVAIGLSEPTFVSAAKARVSDTRKAEDFARELAADHGSIFGLSGAQSVKDKINRSVEADVTMLRRVADYLKRSAAQLKEKSPSHHAIPSVFPATGWNVQRDNVRTAIGIVLLTSLVVSAALIVTGPLLAIPLTVLATAAVAGVITAVIVTGAANLLKGVSENVSTEQGRDRVLECLQEVDRTYDNCLVNSPTLALMGVCLAQLVLNSALCLTVE